MTLPAGSQVSFAYEAQTLDGKEMSGTIDAAHMDDASRRLHTLGLRVMEMRPANGSARPSGRALSGDDFIAFNDQLAHLAAAGLPVEQGLRLLAADLKHGRLADTVGAVAMELDRGASLEDAVGRHESKFPPLYAQLVKAGIKSGNLGAMLLSLGRHVETVQRLRRSLWRVAAYPAMVFVTLLIVLLFLNAYVFPQFQEMYAGFGYGNPERDPVDALGLVRPRGVAGMASVGPQLPGITRALLAVGRVVPFFAIAVLVVVVLCPLGWKLMRLARLDGALGDALLLHVPLIGRALRASLVARWCDAMYLGVQAGLDLPGALRLAGEAVHSPGLKRDSLDLAAALERGMPLDSVGAAAILPAVVPSTLELASRASDLPAALGMLSQLYQRQAEQRIRAIPVVLAPILLAIVALIIGFVIAGLLTPMVRLIDQIARWLV